MSIPGDIVDLEALQELSTLLEDEFLALLSAYRTDALQHIDGMKAALVEREATKLRNHAHSLKGSSANVYARSLAACCETLEHDALAGNLDQAASQIQEIEQKLHTVLDVFKNNGWL
ncbi:MAG: Hpt domain-containing protein [Gammaproteobacteria bacterium]|nr:MAG: Hpt domain-containing protein [Gammaproteobacteria bacterium]